MKAKWKKYRLNFRIPAGTSRGILKNKETWILYLEDELGGQGIGECGLLKGLSWDDRPEYEEILTELCSEITQSGRIPALDNYKEWPSIRFGLEMARLDLKNGGSGRYYASAFTKGKQNIPINGLIWMGSKEQMLVQVEEKIKMGFNCLKMKVGAIDFREELDVLQFIRDRFSAGDLILRVDANGAFTPGNAMDYLEALAELELHSIEQPIRPGQWYEMAKLIEKSPVPIALDEELIPIHSSQVKQEMLDIIRPPYIILKPSFTGGFAASEEWIQMAERKGIGWWITSALESNIGLNAIAQWTATLPTEGHQGLGTGGLYTNNFEAPLSIVNGELHYTPDK